MRLFTTHLQFLSEMKTDNQIDQTKYATNDELKRWSDLLFKLASNESSEQIIICKEAAQALTYVINLQASSFAEKIAVGYQYILENKHPILIKQILLELNKNETLLNWIEILCDENKKFSSLEILYSFIDIYFNTEKTEI